METGTSKLSYLLLYIVIDDKLINIINLERIDNHYKYLMCMPGKCVLQQKQCSIHWCKQEKNWFHFKSDALGALTLSLLNSAKRNGCICI